MDFEALSVAVIASFAVMKLIEALVSPLWDKYGLDRFWLLYVGFVPTAALAWFTGLNVLPVFAEAPIVGRVLTCLAMGFGPSFLWDLTEIPQKPQV
jgi:uncharacterized membrane protein